MSKQEPKWLPTDEEMEVPPINRKPPIIFDPDAMTIEEVDPDGWQEIEES